MVGVRRRRNATHPLDAIAGAAQIMTHIKDTAKGNWKHLLPTLGVDSRYLVNKHGPCPICDGKDRFRWDDLNDGGGYICSQCGSGDGFDLAGKVLGKSFKDIAAQIETIMGTPATFKRKDADPEEVRQRNAMRGVWVKSRPIADISPAANYLRVRLGASAPPLQFVREVDGAFHTADQSTHPAMVAKVVGWNDLAVNIHLTYLTRDGKKASVAPAKKVMPGKLPDGCAIRLMPASEIMGVAEGIETAISASLLFGIPVWACVNGNLLAKWKPPEEAHEIVVFGDNDTNYTGQAKAYELANRLEVQFKRRTKVMIPKNAGTDWNDFYLEREVAESRY